MTKSRLVGAVEDELDSRVGVSIFDPGEDGNGCLPFCFPRRRKAALTSLSARQKLRRFQLWAAEDRNNEERKSSANRDVDHSCGFGRALGRRSDSNPRRPAIWFELSRLDDHGGQEAGGEAGEGVRPRRGEGDLGEAGRAGSDE